MRKIKLRGWNSFLTPRNCLENSWKVLAWMARLKRQFRAAPSWETQGRILSCESWFNISILYQFIAWNYKYIMKHTNVTTSLSTSWNKALSLSCYFFFLTFSSWHFQFFFPSPIELLKLESAFCSKSRRRLLIIYSPTRTLGLTTYQWQDLSIS